MTPRIAYVGADRQIHVVLPDGTGRRQVTFARLPGPLTGWGGTEGRDACSWPCWSPEGRWLACFQSERGEDVAGPASVSVVEVDGVEERLLADLGGQQPIYARWSPRGDRLAVLAQDEDDLQLQVYSVSGPERRRVVEEGVPLFFSWAPEGGGVLVHVGSRRDSRSRLVVRDAVGRGEDILFPVVPGSFCTPLYVGGSTVFVSDRGRSSSLCVSDPRGRGHRELATFEGLLAVVAEPGGRRVAVSSAPEGESTPYQGVWLAPLDGGELVRVVEDDCMAFFFDPTGRRLITAAWDGGRGCLWWRVHDLTTGEGRKVAPFWPTRDQLFFLHFFEQFAESHSAVSPDGNLLVYASYPDPREIDETGATVRIVDLSDPKAEVRRLGQGQFGVFSPPPVE